MQVSAISPLTELKRTKVKRYQNTNLGISGHQSRMPMVLMDSQGMTSY